MTIDLKRFVPIKGERRRIYFDGLGTEDMELLSLRGYEPVNLMELPRGDTTSDQNYLFALLQGMTEGTIEVSKDRINACELELRARHMLNANAPAQSAPSTINVEDVREYWNWGDSRHTLQGNSTIVDPKQVDALAGRKIIDDALPRRKK